ncbi:MAG: hypothetical protein JNK82_11025, partial [Myxococcaceae bacterium]|nr:hypothetical protein [Myxococcaceae bacterium]
PPSRFVLNVVSETGGSVTRTPDAADYVEESVVTVTATPLEGYRFTGWKLDGATVGTSAQMTVTMDRAHDVVASFEVVPPAAMPSMPPPPTMMQPPPSMNPQQPPPAQPAPPPSMHVEPMQPAPTPPTAGPPEQVIGGCQAAPASAMLLAAIAMLIRRRR